MELVSVIVPIYNMEKYLSRCIETLLMQTYENIEIILIDDGSTDTSKVISDAYEKKYPEKIRVYHKENAGLSSARNTGIMLARGKYVIFPDPDDWVDANYLSALIELQRLHNSDLVCTGYSIEYDDKSINSDEIQNVIILSGEDAQVHLFLKPCLGGFAWNKLYHMDIIKKYSLIFLDDVGTTEDLDFAYRYLSHCKKVSFASFIHSYHYYQREGAATHGGFSVKKLQSIHTYEKIIEECNSNKMSQIVKEEICNTAINLILIYLNSNIEDDDSYFKIKKYIKYYIFVYLRSRRFSFGRKVQAIMALFIPKIYCKLKNKFSRE